MNENNETSKEKHLEALNIADVSGSLPLECEIRTPIENALYATGKFTTDECTYLAEGILQYLADAKMKVVWQ